MVICMCILSGRFSSTANGPVTSPNEICPETRSELMARILSTPPRAASTLARISSAVCAEAAAGSRVRSAMQSVRSLMEFMVAGSASLRLVAALFTSSGSGATPQPIEVKCQSEQQSLPHLCGQAATRCFGRELAFNHREDGFYFGARTIQLPRKSAVHLIAEFSFRNAAPRVGRDHAVGSQRAANVAVIGFGVELRICQHHTNGDRATGRVHQARQSTGVAPRTLSRSLRQDDLAIHIDHDQPLQKVSVARFPARMLLNTAYEISAHGVLRKPGTVDGHTSPASATARTVAQSARTWSMVSSGSRHKNRYTVVWSGTLDSRSVARNSLCSRSRTSASRKVQSS